MPIIKSAKKQMRQDERRYAQNLRTKRALKEATKAFEAKPTFDGLKKVQSRIDTAVKKNVLKKNTGARKMARYSRIAKDAGVKIPSAAKKVAAKPVAKVAAKPVAKKPAAKAAPKPAAKKPASKPAAAKK
ncbi:MAG: 30S ribosomal protein S20 [Candidatus Nomurabacteria bacterium]|jgi:histone H1/5|nr:30S ribosomal protein S20 [Candidatus Nomurabacteria bacterium]